MVYLKDFAYFKPKPSTVAYLKKFEGPKKRISLSQLPKQTNKSLGGILKPYVHEYLDTAAVNGFRYLTHPKLKYYERFIWLLILIATSVACCFVYLDLADLYQSQRLQTTVEDSVYPVFMIPFPAIALCPLYRIDWQRLHNEAPQKFLPADASNETLEAFFAFFEKLADVQFGSLKFLRLLFNNTQKPTPNLTLIDDVDILAVMHFLAPTCTEAFTDNCRWRRTSYNCCELFVVERTEAGFCYVFNSKISTINEEKAKLDPFYPRHNAYFGEGTGLQARIRINATKIIPGYKVKNGVYVMIKHATQWHANTKFVIYNSYTKIAISAYMSQTGNRVRAMPPDARRCIFADETHHYMYKNIPGLDYWVGNCLTKCHQEYVVKYCNCNLRLYHPASESDNFTSCKPSDYECAYEHANIFSREHHIFESKYIPGIGNGSMTCNCLNNCNQLLYDSYFNSDKLEGIDPRNNDTFVQLDIHYQSAHVLKTRTSMRFTFVELLANFGGVIGLFLGASLLSAIELIYYFTIGLYARLHVQLQEWYGKRNISHSSQKIRVVKWSHEI